MSATCSKLLRQMKPPSPTGVLLLYMGGPETLDDVEPFLLNLFSDRELIQLPGGGLLQRPFARMITHFRAPRVRGYYQQIGGGSPLLRITRAQGAALAEALAPHGEFVVELAMRYCAPRVEQALQQLRQQGVERCVALPLYPHFSDATTGSSFNDLDRALAAAPGIEVARVQDFHNHPLYLDALAGTVQRALEQCGPEATVIFSAHSLPVKMIERGDPYQRQVETTVAGVAQRLSLERWELAYQSRSGPVRWLEPELIGLVDGLLEQGQRDLVLVPVSFVSDHIETLHEIDIALREHCEQRGVRRFARAEALNEDPRFIEALAQLVTDACQNL